MRVSRRATLVPFGADWLGDVPSDWAVVSGRRVLEVRRDAAREGDQQLSATQRYGVVPQREFMEREDQKVMLALSGVGNFKHVEPDDFVISLRSFEGGIEHSAFSGCVSPAYTVLRLRNAGEPSYFRHLLKSGLYVAALQSTTDSLRDGKSINYEQFGSIPLPIPPLPEQASIAAYLDRETGKIDALVAEQRRLIKLLKEKRQAVISHAVTKGLDPNAKMKPSGVEWLGDVPEHWDILTCRHLLARIEQGWSPECENRQADVHEWGVLKAGCANGTIFRESENKALPANLAPLPELEVRAGDVIMSRANGSPENVGATAYVRSVRSKLMLSDKTFRLLPSQRVRPEFLALLLSSQPLRYQVERSISGAGGLANNLPQSALRAFVGVAPPLEEQDAILERVQDATESIEVLGSKAEEAIALLLERRSALISAAVTGKIDVRGRVRHEVAA